MPSRVETWRERRAAIAEILRVEKIHSQSELLRQLRKRRYRVTQPSISRDLADIGVVKVNGRYVARETLSPPEGSGSELGQVVGLLRSVDPAGPNLLILKTPPGAASQVAIAIEGEVWPEVVGTIAGDDTVFIATPGRAQRARIETRLERFMEGAVGA
jgi:transcriptional regulator of arginine metabolism